MFQFRDEFTAHSCSFDLYSTSFVTLHYSAVVKSSGWVSFTAAGWKRTKYWLLLTWWSHVQLQGQCAAFKVQLRLLMGIYRLLKCLSQMILEMSWILLLILMPKGVDMILKYLQLTRTCQFPMIDTSNINLSNIRYNLGF